MPRRDMWGECYAGEHQQRLGPEEFKRFFCRLCRNPECVNSATGSSRWVNRIETQVDRLLDNPLIADPNDPKFKALRALNFEDAIRDAMSLEISSRRGDWEIPTEEDALALATEMAAKIPGGFQAPEPEVPEPEEDDEPEVEILWEGDAKGNKKGVTYKVTLARVGDSEPTWSCTCPSTKYGTAPPGGCKHVVLAMGMMEQQREEETKVVEETAAPEDPTREETAVPPLGVDPEIWKQMRDRNRVPKSPNTPAPSEGVMIGGASPPSPVDDWSAPVDPTPVGEVIAVGGKIVMGGGGKTTK